MRGYGGRRRGNSWARPSLTVSYNLRVACVLVADHADPNQLMALLQVYPWHVDTLLQMSEVYRLQSGKLSSSMKEGSELTTQISVPPRNTLKEHFTLSTDASAPPSTYHPEHADSTSTPSRTDQCSSLPTVSSPTSVGEDAGSPLSTLPNYCSVWTRWSVPPRATLAFPRAKS
jgi:hypothetical protein